VRGTGYLGRVAIAFDVFCNVLLNGAMDETLSARSGRAARAGKLWGKLLAGVLNYCFPGHCQGAIQHDKWRAEYVVWLETQNGAKGIYEDMR
jgi:hypothetical protein